MTTETCPDCLRPPATKTQWDNGHDDEPVVAGFGGSCECAECVSACWDDAAYCAKVKDERESKPTAEERYRAALEKLAIMGEYNTCIVCGRGDSPVYGNEPHHETCLIGTSLKGA